MDGFYERTPEIRPSRKNFSRLGWGLTALLLVPVAIQLLLLLVMGVMGPALLGDLWFSMALSTGSLYLVGYPLAWFLLRRLPEAEVSRANRSPYSRRRRSTTPRNSPSSAMGAKMQVTRRL